MEVSRELGGGISLSAKSRHLPLRKQSRHDSMGKSTSSLIEAALFLMPYFCNLETLTTFANSVHAFAGKAWQNPSVVIGICHGNPAKPRSLVAEKHCSFSETTPVFLHFLAKTSIVDKKHGLFWKRILPVSASGPAPPPTSSASATKKKPGCPATAVASESHMIMRFSSKGSRY